MTSKKSETLLHVTLMNFFFLPFEYVTNHKTFYCVTNICLQHSSPPSRNFHFIARRKESDSSKVARKYFAD